MNDNKFDKITGDKLRSYTERPPAALFSRIEKSLAECAPVAKPMSVRRKPLWYALRIGAAAVMLFGLAMGISLLSDRKAPAEQIAEGIATARPDVVDTPQRHSGGMLSETTETITVAQRPTEIAPANTTKSVTKRSKEPRLSEKLRDIIIGEATETKQDATQEIQLSKVVAEAITAQQANVRSDTRSIAQATDNSRQAAEARNFWNNVMNEDSKSRNRRTSRISAASLYASNFGVTNGDFKSNDPGALVTNKMMVRENPNATLADYAEMNEPQYVVQKTSVASSRQDEFELTHRMPISGGVTFALPVAENLSVVTGLNYTYLSSYSKQYSGRTDNVTSMSREAHYLGIPFGLNYSLYKSRRVDVYLFGGGMIEKSVYAHNIKEIGTDSGNAREYERIKVKGIQPSIRAAVGAQFYMGKNLSLYVEPGVAYYFEQIDQLPSYRTEHPTSFSLSLGFRFGFGR